MKARVYLFVSLVAGCGLVQVNGKPLGGSSSSPSSPSSSASETPASSGTSSERTTPAVERPREAAAKVEQPPAEEDGGSKSLDDIAKPGASRARWSPIQQFKALATASPYGAIILADELGDRLSQAGRVGLVAACFEHVRAEAMSAASWAACGADVEALDLNALGQELRHEGLSRPAREGFIEKTNKTLTEAKEIGKAVMDAAKGDPGVAAIVEMGKAAREEWHAFASAHPDQLAELATLQDLVRANKNGLAGDCVGKTRPAMEKVVRSTKWRERDNPVFPAKFFINLAPTTTDAFIATLAWTACATLTHPSGKTLYAAAMETDYGYSQQRWRRYHRRGPRSLTIAKLYQDPFKPKFADRSLSMDSIREPSGGYSSGLDGDRTPSIAVISKLVSNGDETTIKLANDKVMECADWRDTNKVQSIAANGDLIYEKKCMRRQAVVNEHDDIVTATAFTAGLAPGVELTEQYDFPVVGMKGGKVVAAFGIKL